jgi:2-desacetyl-2-hydroxyethyl bacteriochlorophyllide A dehydrogenase
MMKAVVFAGAGQPMVLEDRDKPVADSGELILKVKACGICGSDLHGVIAADASPYRDGVIMGHEFCGEVAEIGAGVNGWSLGERVLGVPAWFCEQCDSCQQGKPFQCQNLQGIGIDVDGAYAEYVRIKAATAVKIPDHLSDEMAVLYEPLSVALQAFRRGNIAEADNVLILGGGPIGLSLAMLARHFGAKFVGLSELHPERLKRAGACGVDVVIDASQSKDPVATFVEQTGVAPSVIFECVGLPGMFQRVIDMAPLRSRVVMTGTCLESESFTVVQAAQKYLDVQFTYAYDEDDIATVLDIMASGSIDPSPMLSNRTSLDDLPQTIERMLSPNAECKVVVCPS